MTTMDIELMIVELNELYHRLLKDNSHFVVREKFKNLVHEVRLSGYRFIIGVPIIDFNMFELNDHEVKLFIRLEIVRLLKIDAIQERLTWFSVEMRDCEHLLCRLIYVSLCCREVLDKRYFILRDNKRIDFMWAKYRVYNTGMGQ